MTSPPLPETFGASVPYLMYAIFALLSFVVVLTKVPETNGIELEQVGEAKVTRRPGRTAPTGAAATP